MDTLDSVKLYATPKLRHPYIVAAWSGMGAVALLSANVLRQELNAKLLGEIDPHNFFSPTQTLVQEGLIQEPVFPETKLYFWDKGREHDLIILIGTEQPSNAHDMALLVLDVAQRFGVERIHTTAAMATFIHHSHEPRVWGTATHSDLLAEMQTYGVTVMEQGTIGGLNGLLLATAKEHGIKALCLLGEIPAYATYATNPVATRAVLVALTAMLGVQIDLMKLELWGEQLAPQMDRLYEALPDQIKEAIETETQAARSISSAAHRAEQPPVANDRFFDEIERFLKQHWKPEDEEQDEED